MSPKIRAISVYIDTLMPISSKKNKKDPRAIKNRAICNKRLQSLGWQPEYTIKDALVETYEWYYKQ